MPNCPKKREIKFDMFSLLCNWYHTDIQLVGATKGYIRLPKVSGVEWG